jgi:hypothetical protein
MRISQSRFYHRTKELSNCLLAVFVQLVVDGMRTAGQLWHVMQLYVSYSLVASCNFAPFCLSDSSVKLRHLAFEGIFLVMFCSFIAFCSLLVPDSV